MQVKTCLKTGQKGTKKWVDVYGDRLVCVRYRYDAKKEHRCTTVEIIAEEGHSAPSNTKESPARNVEDLVGIRVVGYERELREKVKSAGGIWRPSQQLWDLPYDQIFALGLSDRIVEDQV